MRSFAATFGALALGITLASGVNFSVFSSRPRIVRGTTATDVTFNAAFTAAPICVCTYVAGGFDPAVDMLICVGSTTALDIDVNGGGDPPVPANYICIGN